MSVWVPKVNPSYHRFTFCFCSPNPASSSAVKTSSSVKPKDVAYLSVVGCLGQDTGEAVLKAMLAVGHRIPKRGILLSTGSARHKAAMLTSAQLLHKHGYTIYATRGTHAFLSENGIPAVRVYMPSQPEMHPQALDLLHSKDIDLVVNIPKNLTPTELSDGYKVRRASIDLNIPLLTNPRLAEAFISAFTSLKPGEIEIKSWDEY